MDPDGRWTSTRAVLLAAAGQNCWPPAGSYMAATGQDLMAADTLLPPHPGLHRQTNRRRQNPPRSPTLPQTLHRPPDLPPPPTPQNQHLTNIEASFPRRLTWLRVLDAATHCSQSDRLDGSTSVPPSVYVIALFRTASAFAASLNSTRDKVRHGYDRDPLTTCADDAA